MINKDVLIGKLFSVRFQDGEDIVHMIGGWDEMIQLGPSYQEYQVELERLLALKTLDAAEVANNVFQWTMVKCRVVAPLSIEQIEAVLEYQLNRDPNVYEMAGYVRNAVYGSQEVNSTEWRPLDTAPKTGHILGWDPHFKRPFVMMWNIPGNKFLASDSVFKDETPVAWMPLPEGPKA